MMLKNIRNAGYVQIYIGVGLITGFVVVRYQNPLFAFLILGLAILAMIFLTIKDASEMCASNPEISFQDALKPVGIFYCVILSVLMVTFVVGVLMV